VPDGGASEGWSAAPDGGALERQSAAPDGGVLAPWGGALDWPTVEFEKWQALGNDYVIVEEQQLPFELTAPRIQAICAPHTGVAADGILLLSEPEQDGYVARLRIFNPDGSEAELSGNGAREAVLYLRRHQWTDADSFAIQTAAGDIRPRILSDTECTVDMGPAHLRSPGYPSGGPDGRGELTAGGRTWRFQHVQTGNPQCAIRVSDEAELEALDLQEIGPGIERHALFPNRTNVSWFTELDDDDDGGPQIRARIFERGVGETAASGTGATGAAVAYVLDGGRSPVTVVLDGGELTVDVAEDLQTKLTGWAVPVYRATLAATFLEELHATQ
jgi:diaminopimelate epimerase